MDSNITPKQLINKIVYSRFPYFDIKNNKKSFKLRPVLLIGNEKETFQTDFTAFPISTVSNKEHLNQNYDIDIGKKLCPKLKTITKNECYVRVHKPTTVSSLDINRDIKFEDLSTIYVDKYNDILDAWKDFNSTLFQ